MSTSKKNVRIHPTAEVSSDATIGEGTRVWHHVQIRERVRIGNNCIIGKGVYIDFDVTIGDNCKLQNGVNVYHPAVVEDGVFLGPGVIITNDKLPRAVNPDQTLKTDADWLVDGVLIGRGASVGAGSILLPGIRIGEWAMIGAGSVVTRDVPDFGLAVGNPAKLIGYVCSCGSRLNEVEPSRYICSLCGSTYEFDGVLRSLNPQS
jgi:UDP-2-acetamido-3-amino-2,3-dideoxy-glucuronate N-acetyltransferase